MADINITVTVDTENVSQADVNTAVTLTDDNGGFDVESGNSSTFETTAVAQSKLIWTPASVNGTDTVAITGINYNSGDHIFDGDPVQNSDGTWQVYMDAQITEGQEEEYDIVFSVSNKPGESFTLDPKVRTGGSTSTDSDSDNNG